MSKKQNPPKDRNPYVEHLRFKKSGAHVKSKKAVRQQEKEKLKKQGRDYFNKFII